MLKKLMEKATRNKNESVTGINFWHPASLIGTFFGVGRIPFAPGTWGALAGMFVPFLIFYVGAIILALFPETGPAEKTIFITAFFILNQLLLFFIGSLAANIYTRKTGISDPSRVVIDEVLGSLVACFFAWVGACIIDQANIFHPAFLLRIVFSVPFYLAVFLFFRLFDIWKPWPIGLIDRKMKSGFGVMLDDVVAGIFAATATDLLFMGYYLITG